MRALVYTAPRRLERREWPRPRPEADEVEVAVAAAGICGADIAGFLGRSRQRTPPLILGHELVGRTPVGRRVVVDPVIGCGQCAECRGGKKNLCSNLRLLGMDPLDGCFAEFIAIPRAQAYPIAEEMSDGQAILAEPLANVVHLFRLAGQEPGFRLGVVGAGTMGSLALQMGLHLGASAVLVEDVVEERLAAARRMGATLAVHAECEAEAADGVVGGGLDLVVDACGEERARQRALEMCRPGGTVVLLGMAKGRSEVDFNASIRREHRVLMSFGYTDGDFRKSLDLLSAGTIDLEAWTEEMALEDGQAAFERMTARRGGTLKMILRVSR